jgi:predicted RecA/RadA family phage recombinase
MAKKMELYSSNYKEIQAVAAAALSAGDVVTAVDLVGFPIVDVANGATYTLVVAAEKVKVEKAAGSAWVAGDSVYWDSGDENFNLSATDNTLVGYVLEAATSAATEAWIVFDGSAANLKA